MPLKFVDDHVFVLSSKKVNQAPIWRIHKRLFLQIGFGENHCDWLILILNRFILLKYPI